MDNVELTTGISWLQQIGLNEGLVAACIIGTFGLCGILFNWAFPKKCVTAYNPLTGE